MKTEAKTVQSRFRALKTIEPGALHQKIVQKAATPIASMADRLVVDAGTLSTIGELYANYAAYCLTRHAPPLPREIGGLRNIIRSVQWAWN
jgi:hypothetical protein